ncbi:MAG: tRNA pseudouridine(13) synthase TruD [Planctomycetes bacterium]|nr:tRNA pseudouridine(13) synthase TruD [Planctomycetota bacterium]
MPPIQIKRLPEDFRVEELTNIAPSRGEFALYQLAKRSLTTLDVLESVARHWNIPRRALSHAGMKDRHATTIQYITIHNGPRGPLALPNFTLEYLGQVPREISANDTRGNRFAIVLRNFSEDVVAPIARSIEEIRKYHIPNYFDDQRFRSVGPSGEFIARAWCETNYERALWLALAEENYSDRGPEKQQKAALRELWGNWAEANSRLEKSHRRSIITYLADHPVDFRGAFERVRVELRRIYLIAFQSYLWNRVLRGFVEERVPESARAMLPHSLGAVPAPRTLSNEDLTLFENLLIPLPAARAKIEAGEMRDRIERSLAEVGFSLEAMKIKHGRDAWFPGSRRPAISRIGALVWGFDDDELHPRRKLLRLSFELGRGSYATLFLKRILLECKEFDEAAIDDVEEL